ncbi:MAG TPA: DNA-deoxyinosine glycosylase [Thermoleophilia bacterium]|nr:DNA-deoxyinosine glycosylase [Thermoleophilia bacterium]
MIGFDPIVGPEPRVLILGTAPSEQSLREGRYYAHPRNEFWPIMEELFADGRPLDYAARVRMLKKAGIALWDVLAEAERVGSLDADIKAPVANDLGRFLRDHPTIGTVFFNGATAERLFQAQCAAALADSTARATGFVRLPSTSPANASISSALKRAAWKAVRVAAEKPASTNGDG